MNPSDALERFEAAIRNLGEVRFHLTLFVSGTSQRSQDAISSVRALCDANLPGRYELEVVNVQEQPTIVARAQVLAAPSLVRERPEPVRVLVGNLSDEDRILDGLEIRFYQEQQRP